MEYTLGTKMVGEFFYKVCKKELNTKCYYIKDLHSQIITEYKNIILRSKPIGEKNRLLSAYLLAAYFIAMNRKTKLQVDENFKILKQGLENSTLFRKACGNGKNYFKEKKMQDRKQWDKDTHQRKYEKDWVVSFIEGNDDFVFGFDYTECGVCKLCKQENCFELAHYLCELDFLMVEIMGIHLERTKTLANGNDVCDFRFKR